MVPAGIQHDAHRGPKLFPVQGFSIDGSVEPLPLSLESLCDQTPNTHFHIMSDSVMADWRELKLLALKKSSYNEPTRLRTRQGPDSSL